MHMVWRLPVAATQAQKKSAPSLRTRFRYAHYGAQGLPDSAAQDASESESDAEQRPRKRRKERQKGGKIPKRDSSRSKAFFQDLL